MDSNKKTLYSKILLNFNKILFIVSVPNQPVGRELFFKCSYLHAWKGHETGEGKTHS